MNMLLACALGVPVLVSERLSLRRDFRRCQVNSSDARRPRTSNGENELKRIHV